jgi:hypothetical protein
MAQNFIGCDREQELLLPPSLREWLPGDHLAWFVIDAVAAMGLAAFYAVYRQDGHGRAAHEPSMMVTLLMYAYAIGERSSRASVGPAPSGRTTFSMYPLASIRLCSAISAPSMAVDGTRAHRISTNRSCP